VNLLRKEGIAITPLVAANCGYDVGWPSEFLALAEGLPLKNIVVSGGETFVSGELLITKYGLEGGALYQLGRALRTMTSPQIEIDLKPAFTVDQLAAKIRHASIAHLLDQATRAWRLNRASSALLQLRSPFASAADMAALAKAYPVTLRGPRPIEEAISTAGGVKWDELDDQLMLKRCPGVFCAGEMIDWDAPTGGYLIQGCFSTATRAAKGMLKFLTELDRSDMKDMRKR
jgi:predicted flavoprotein YhiN